MKKYDAIIVGAGFSGIYMVHKLKKLGLNVIAIEAAEGVGGVWHWNRYPGARCDSESIHYNFTFSEELFKGWTWKSRYSEQPKILEYLNYVTDSLNVRGNILFSTKVTKSQFNPQESSWNVHLDDGQLLTCNYFITAVGNISATNIPSIPGLVSFKGDWYHTGNWPKEKVDFKDKKVGVIGTGSSGVQAIPVIANAAESLKVFQRTPNYIIPANNYDYTEEEIQDFKNNYESLKYNIRNSAGGTPYRKNNKSVFDDDLDTRREVLESAWNKGGIFPMNNSYRDILTNAKSNEEVAKFVRMKIAEKIQDDTLINEMIPTHLYNTKRTITDTNYFETFNLSHVDLVNLHETPIVGITKNGIKTSEDEFDLDIIVFATGYDGITGNLFKIDIIGLDGVKLSEKWELGNSTSTYLGMMTSGFPNLFFITGPETPAVLTNIPATIEQNVEWIADLIHFMKKEGIKSFENTVESEFLWSAECREIASTTLYSKTESWYTGANVEGKAQNILIYLGGLDEYTKICNDAAENNYSALKFQKVIKVEK